MRQYLTDERPVKYVQITDPILKEVIPEYDFDKDEPYNEVRLVESMLEMQLMSLTAPEIGDRVRVMAIGDPRDFTTVVVLYNPKIINQSDEMLKMEEVIPANKKLANISRPVLIKVRYMDDTGIPHTKEFSGLTARLMHRSIRQLDGSNTYFDIPIVERLRSSNIIV